MGAINGLYNEMFLIRTGQILSAARETDASRHDESFFSQYFYVHNFSTYEFYHFFGEFFLGKSIFFRLFLRL